MEEHIKKGRESDIRHYLTNLYVDEEGCDARVRFYILNMSVGGSGPSIVATAGANCEVRLSEEALLYGEFGL